MLTDPGDVVVDIFAGSNTTGMVAEAEGRRWMAFDMDLEYLAASSFRFLSNGTGKAEMQEIYESILAKNCVRLDKRVGHQAKLLAAS